jgi:hypothetical protein
MSRRTSSSSQSNDAAGATDDTAVMIKLDRGNSLEQMESGNGACASPRGGVLDAYVHNQEDGVVMSSLEALPLSPITFSPERRISLRVAALLPVSLVSESGESFPAAAVDIGLGGIGVEVTNEISPKLIRLIRLTLDRHHLELEVTCRWFKPVRPGGHSVSGLSFNQLDAKSEGALWNFIQLRGREIALFLRDCDGLSQIEFQDAFELTLAARLRRLEEGELVYDGADLGVSNSIFALFRGAVQLERVRQARVQPISDVGPFQIFGGMPPVAGCVPFERAIATKRSMILQFTGYNVECLLSTKPRLGIALLRAASYHWMRRFAATLDLVPAES